MRAHAPSTLKVAKPPARAYQRSICIKIPNRRFCAALLHNLNKRLSWRCAALTIIPISNGCTSMRPRDLVNSYPAAPPAATSKCNRRHYKRLYLTARSTSVRRIEEKTNHNSPVCFSKSRRRSSACSSATRQQLIRYCDDSRITRHRNSARHHESSAFAVP